MAILCHFSLTVDHSVVVRRVLESGKDGLSLLREPRVRWFATKGGLRSQGGLLGVRLGDGLFLDLGGLRTDKPDFFTTLMES